MWVVTVAHVRTSRSLKAKFPGAVRKSSNFDPMKPCENERSILLHWHQAAQQFTPYHQGVLDKHFKFCRGSLDLDKIGTQVQV